MNRSGRITRSLDRAAARRATPLTALASTLALAIGGVGSSAASAAESFVDQFEGGHAACWVGFTVWTDVTVEPDGGQDGGWLRSAAGEGHVDAGIATTKPEVGGDWLIASVSSLTLDIRRVSGTFAGGGFRVREGGDVNGWTFPVSADVVDDAWTTISAPLDPMWTDEDALAAGWLKEGPGVPSWTATLASHYQLAFRASGGPGLEMGYDNVTLAFAGPSCTADTNEDQMVDLSDLLAVLAAWGDCTCCPADVTRDRSVGFEDVVSVLSTWGACWEG